MRYLALLLGCCCVIWVQCLSCGTFAQIRVGDAAFGLISPAKRRPMTCGSAASARRLMSNPPLWSVRGGSLPSVVRDGAVSALILTESYVWLKLWSGAAANGRLHSNVTRKIIHATSAPLFLLHWPLFSRSPTARFFAAAVPLVQAARLVHAVSKSSRTGKGTNAHIIASTDEDLVKGMSRSGSEAEIWGGPFLYTLVLLVTTLTLFRTPAAVVALCQLAVGDGLSDLVGRYWMLTFILSHPFRQSVSSFPHIPLSFIVIRTENLEGRSGGSPRRRASSARPPSLQEASCPPSSVSSGSISSIQSSA